MIGIGHRVILVTGPSNAMYASRISQRLLRCNSICDDIP
jgi:hypothetical protein